MDKLKKTTYRDFHVKNHNDLVDLFVEDPPEIEDGPVHNYFPSFDDLNDLKKDQRGFNLKLKGKGNLDSPVGNMEIIPSTDTRSDFEKELYGPLPKDSVKLTLGNQKVNTSPGLSFEPGIQEIKRQEESDALVAADNADIQKGIALATAEKAKANSPLLSSMQKVLLGLGAAGAGYGLYKYLTKKKKKPVIYQNQLEYNT